MTKRKAVRNISPEDQVVVEERSEIVNYEEVRLGLRGLDKFTIHMKNGDVEEVFGHEIGVASGVKGPATDLPVYQIWEYAKAEAEMKYTRAYNSEGKIDQSKQLIVVEYESSSDEYVKVVKAILWPGEWVLVTRETSQEQS